MSKGAPKQARQLGHRGWLIVNMSMDNVVKCAPAPFCREKLSEFPHPLIWPRYGDLVGGKALVEAVMSKDVAALMRMEKQWPDYDLGLGEWFKKLKSDYVAETAKKRKVLRQRLFPNARRLTVELVTDTDRGTRSIVACFYRGRTRLTEKTLVADATKDQESDHE